MVFLQAFIDDSATEPASGRLFMAGYINTVEKWAKFSDDWDAALKRHPSIKYFTMKEAYPVRGQFRGWSDPKRDMKIAELSEVIRRYKPDSFHFSINRAAYLSEVKPVAPRGINTHYVATFGIVSLVTKYLEGLNFEGKVDFIFDEQSGVSADIHFFFEHIAKNLSKAQRAMIARVPQFGSDKDYLPLQAADMLAWHQRRQHECGDALDGLLRLRADHSAHMAIDAPDELLVKWRDGLSFISGIPLMQSKTGWRRVKVQLATALANGYIPPYGTRWRNFLGRIRLTFIRWRLDRRHRKKS